MARYKIVIIQKSIKFYTSKFYEFLKQLCDRNNIELILIYGKDDVISFNDVEINWGIKVKNYTINLFGKKMYYQNVWKYLFGADLIIVEQATKYLVNHILWLLNLLGIVKLAFWGHGINFQRDKSFITSFSEFIKKLYTKKVSWFFAYTDLSKKLLIEMGLSPNKITVVNNTISVEDLKNELLKWNKNELERIKNELNIKTNNIALFVGGMYKEKRLEFLIEALQIIKKSVTDFEMLFIGDGPDKDLVIQFSEKNDWVHYLGSKNDKEKVPYFLMSKLLLIPGAVGLVIIDSFVFGLPIVATEYNLHGPEICYLENNLNGIMTKNSIEEYTKTVIDLLKDESKLITLKSKCIETSEKYEMKRMVKNFWEGIKSSLMY